MVSEQRSKNPSCHLLHLLPPPVNPLSPSISSRRRTPIAATCFIFFLTLAAGEPFLLRRSLLRPFSATLVTNRKSTGSLSSIMTGAAQNTPHPATLVTNIKNEIPLTLGTEHGHYTSWVELFKLHCTACNVLQHIIPSADSPSSTQDSTWKRIDAIVLKWIYGTITNDLLVTILKPNATAESAWEALATLHVDSKPTRAIYLQNKFTNIKLDQFSDVSSYCQELKTLADQLANVDAPVTDQTLVLRLIAGLNTEYDHIASQLQNSEKLPTFNVARSKLIMEETRKANQSSSTGTALNVQHHTINHPVPTTNQTEPNPPSQHRDGSAGSRGRGYEPNFSRGRGRGSRGRGRGRSRGRGSYGSVGTPAFHQHPPSWQPPYWGYAPSPWATPPCPYPTQPHPPTRPPSRSPGLLGPPPPQAYAASEYSYVPTNIDQAMHTMTLNPDHQWYFDTGATGNMSHSSGLPDADSYSQM